MDKPVLLLKDILSTHWTDEVRRCAAELKVVLVRVSPGCTRVCQPAGISWNKPLTSRLRAKWIANLQPQLQQPHEPGERFKPVAPSRRGVIKWVMEAWSEVSEAVKKIGFSFIFKDQENHVCPAENHENLEETAVVDALESLQLLNEDVGELHPDKDVVDSVLNSLE